MYRNTVGKKIRQAVRETGFTQQNFARKIGIGESLISDWAGGKRNPSLTSLKKIAKATNKPLSYFIDGENFNTISNTGDNAVVGKNQNVNTTPHDVETLKQRMNNLELKVENLNLKISLISKREEHGKED
ncbi:MAG: helix-turn-helix transcriptional regulator [Endomicrobium sp.]|jgi:transcriptional regulator with XRE-family HTH domain|nr:helix-turn-helix transcriptional regulator [Endomicrobium sp.]